MLCMQCIWVNVLYVITRGLYDTALKEISQKQVYSGQFGGQMSQIAGEYDHCIVSDNPDKLIISPVIGDGCIPSECNY